MSRILLIKCNEFVYPYGITHPLGVMSLSATLKKSGHQVEIIDTRIRGRLTPAQVAGQAAEFAPDIIGLSAILVEADNLHATTAEIRKNLPGVPIIIGGPYPSSCPERALADPRVDCAVLGEGEDTFLEVVGRIEKGLSLEHIAGTLVRQNGELAINPPRLHILDLDSLPFPDRESIDIAAYSVARRFSNTPPAPYMSIFTSRACPFGCIYCHNMFGKKYRARSPENVLAEMEEIVARHGIREFEIMDDTFNLDRDRAVKILDGIAASDMKARLLFPNGVRADMLDEELIAKMKSAGTIQVSVAIETASPRLQKLIRKNLRIGEVKKAIEQFAAHGIHTHGFFMFGFPTETAEEMKQTVRFALKSRLHTAGFFIVTPAPGTELFRMISKKQAAEHGKPQSSSYSYQSFNLTGSELSTGKIRRIYKQAFFRFYANPFRILRIIVIIKNKKYLLIALVHVIHRLLFSVGSQKRSNLRKQRVSKAATYL